MSHTKVGPWTRTTTRDIYENPWISLREDEVITPGGNPGIYGVVHFKNIAIGVIPLDEDNNTVLVGQHRYALDTFTWEIPMGGCPEGTKVLDTAARELAEETGLIANTYEQILRTDMSNSVTDEVGYVFIAKGLTQTDMNPDDTEDLTIRHLPLADAIAMVDRGQITDLLSVAGLICLARIQGL
ncbi:MAG: NUDIX hydrolase [Pseudomonadota bacterium]